MSGTHWALPSYGRGFAKNASQAMYPHLWRHLSAAYSPGLGYQGNTLIRYSASRQNAGGANASFTSITNDDWVPSDDRLCLSLDGSSKYVDTNVKPTNFLNGETTGARGTIVWWTRPNTAFNDATTQMMWGAFVNPTEISAQKNSNGNMYIGWNGASDTRAVIAASASNYTQNQWGCYALTYTNGGNTNVYFNGRPIGSFTSSGTSVVYPNATLRIGNIQSGGFFNGKIGDFYIYTRILDMTEIAQISNGASPFIPLAPIPQGKAVAPAPSASSASIGGLAWAWR
jgi:hypothetical protein